MHQRADLSWIVAALTSLPSSTTSRAGLAPQQSAGLHPSPHALHRHQPAFNVAIQHQSLKFVVRLTVNEGTNTNAVCDAELSK